MDTGIDEDSPEFAGRIHTASRDIAASRGLTNADDDHGTNVALIAAAAKDDIGIVGIAYQATIMALRADGRGTCRSECSFSDSDIAAAVRHAVDNGANVVNLSLGGGSPSSVMLSAVRYAASKGVVVVVAAGNDGDVYDDPAIDPDRPDPFAQGLRDAGGGAVIIVGSVNEQREISDFSNRAGGYENAFLTALGESVCCTYEDGKLYEEPAPGGGTYVYLFSGTSFAAPQVSGAVALLAQAFPNLKATEIVQILLDSARDAGDPGADAVYGSGILDIAAAFAPQGTTSLAGTTTAVAMGSLTGVGSTTMGDAVNQTSASAIVLDKYKRAYNLDLARQVESANQSGRLGMAVGRTERSVAAAGEKLAMAFTIDATDRAGGLPVPQQLRLSEDDAEAARVLAGRVALKLSPDSQIALGISEGPHGMVAQLQGHDRPAFMIARDAAGDDGLTRSSDVSFAWRQQVGEWGLTASAEAGRSYAGASTDFYGDLGNGKSSDAARSFGIAADRTFGALDAVLGVTFMQEADSVLGARFGRTFGTTGSDSMFVDASLGWNLAPGWRLGADARLGRTDAASGGLVADGSTLWTQGFSADVARTGVFAANDQLGFRIAQPLRVASGGLNLTLPTGYSYETLQPTWTTQLYDLSPEGREVMGELAWRGPLLGGFGGVSAFYRRQPGHFAEAPDDAGVAMRWSVDF